MYMKEHMMLIILIDLNYEGVFKIWWTFHLVMFIQIHILALAMIIHTTSRHLHVFHQLKQQSTRDRNIAGLY